MTQTMESSELDELAGALDLATSKISGLDPLPRQVVTDVVYALNALHKDGLTTIVRALKNDPRGKELLFELVDDPGVRMVLAMHGIIRPDITTQTRQVLDGVRVGLQSHGGDVELDSVRDGVAHVRLHGACNGCSMAAVTMRDSVEKALVEGVPGVVGVEVLPNDPTPTLIKLSEIGMGAPREDPGPALLEAGWCRTFTVGEVALGELKATTLNPADAAAVEAIIVNAAGQLAAYVNACAHQGLPLDNAMVDGAEGTLTCPWHGLCYDSTTGECMTLPGAQLQQLPLRVENGHVWVRAVGY